VTLCLRVWPGWCARKTQRVILVRAECPYVQSELLVFLHWFAVGVTNGRERENGLLNLWVSVVWVRECYLKNPPPTGVLPFPFIFQGAGVR
jgi:hypothetical protein